MKNNHSYKMIVIFLLLLVSLTACTKELKAPETSEPKTANDPAQPTQMIDIINEFATQTARAIEQPVLDTPQPELIPTIEVVIGPTQETIETIETIATPLPAVPTFTVPETYTLQKDEFVYCIARRFDVNPVELLNLNGMSAGSLVSPGMVLKIPKTGNPFPAARALRVHPTSYTVVSGDTIYKIACLFGDVDPLAIAAVNGLEAPYSLTVGQVLAIP